MKEMQGSEVQQVHSAVHCPKQKIGSISEEKAEARSMYRQKQRCRRIAILQLDNLGVSVCFGVCVGGGIKG